MSARVQEDAAGKLDLTFEDLGEQSLKNIARPVRVYRVRFATAENAPKVEATDSRPALPLPEKPSIAVLPFVNMSGDPEQEYFADGIVEEIITALSRIRWLFVIARNSTFTYKGQAIDVKQVGRELGVRYVLEGSVRKAGQKVRITGQLIDAPTGTHLWADRFDGSLEDIFELQDKVATSVAGVIEPTLQTAETARSAHRPIPDLTAYDLYLRLAQRLGHCRGGLTSRFSSRADDDQRFWVAQAQGRQFCEAAIGPVIDELGQHVGQIGFGIDAVQLASFDQRGEHRPVFRSFVAAGKQSIFSVQSNRANAALDGIGVDLNAAVVEEARQPIPMVEAISDGLGDR